MAERYVCIHGHFYQPPRENPWLEAIELQDSAYPYHDWNERVTAECYAPNTAARVLGKTGLISSMVNNYAAINFNFGPTLLSWMAENAPDTYHDILDADRVSRQRFSGHGSALAQAYNHMIMPLANERDKRTQVLWGIADFSHRYGRKPEGMWLPETAVDLASLDVMAELGIRFTILSTRQALRVRPAGEEWEDAGGGKIDTTMPYSLTLPSGRSIAIFFYCDPIARAVAFEGLLNSGEEFAKRLLGAFNEETDCPQLVHIATDGETYGHHHRFGEMALAYMLEYLEANGLAQVTNYGEYLEKYPPTCEVEIKENTSWSCVHGVERWRANCGCNTGAHPSWNQEWRGPLRDALDWLRDDLSPRYEAKAAGLLKDPWAARDGYIEVVLDRSPSNVERFLYRQASHALSDTEKVEALKLLELQRQAMLMFTSDGWFFDELSGIETLQIMQYAARAIQLAGELFGNDAGAGFLDILERAESNVAELGDGRRVWEQFVKPAVLGLSRVTAHFAISSLFEKQPEQVKISRHKVDVSQYRSFNSGESRLVLGQATATSEVTRESATMDFGVLQAGRRVSAGIMQHKDDEHYSEILQQITARFSSGDFSGVTGLLEKQFGTLYSMGSIFRDEQRRVMERILEFALRDIGGTYRQLYADYYPPMRFLTELGKPIPAFHAAASLILNSEFQRAVSAEALDINYIKDIMERVKLWKVELDSAGLGYRFRQTLEILAARFAAHPDDAATLEALKSGVSLARSMPFPVSLWKAQKVYYTLLSSGVPGLKSKRRERLLELGALLTVETR